MKPLPDTYNTYPSSSRRIQSFSFESIGIINLNKVVEI